MSGMFGGGKKPTVTPAPPTPLRTDADTANLAEAQRQNVRRALGRRATSTTGGLGAPTGGSGLVRLLGGTT